MPPTTPSPVLLDDLRRAAQQRREAEAQAARAAVAARRAAARATQGGHSVTAVAKAAGVSRQAMHSWLKQSASESPEDHPQTD